jgi:flagellar motility protein MotE (MotC chaperone)
MKKFIFVILGFSLLTVFAEEEKVTKDEKVYTQKEFDEKLEKLLFEKLKRFGSENIVNLSQELHQKEKALADRENEIKQREEQVAVVENELTKKIKELQVQKDKILACLDQNDGKEKKRIDHMVEAVSGMRPQSAADVLSVQDPDISVKILDRLPASKVSKIFNSMKKEISARLQKQYMNMKK